MLEVQVTILIPLVKKEGKHFRKFQMLIFSVYLQRDSQPVLGCEKMDGLKFFGLFACFM